MMVGHPGEYKWVESALGKHAGGTTEGCRFDSGSALQRHLPLIAGCSERRATIRRRRGLPPGGVKK